jgi:hypothetical protein
MGEQRRYAMQEDTKTAKTPSTATNGEVTQVFTPRTPLGKRLWELRKKHLASGEPLLTLDEVRREVQARRGGIADEEGEA